MARVKHASPHKYKRVQMRKDNPNWIVFRCMLPDCSHYLPTLEMVINKLSLCWGCEQQFLITKEHVERVKPTCESCVSKKYSLEDIDKLAEELMRGD